MTPEDMEKRVIAAMGDSAWEEVRYLVHDQDGAYVVCERRETANALDAAEMIVAHLKTIQSAIYGALTLLATDYGVPAMDGLCDIMVDLTNDEYKEVKEQ